MYIFCRDINRSNGKAIILDGDLYYSPNCSRDVGLPPDDTNHTKFQNVFRTSTAGRSPRWWTPAFGWMSFIPLSPSYKGVPFDMLLHVPNPEFRDNAGYCMPETAQARWARLEDAIIKSTAILTSRLSLPAVRPHCPWSYGYHLMFKTHRIALKQCVLARDWFPVWMGLFSFLIASARTMEEQSTSIPCWFQILADAGYDQTFLNGIRSSTVCSFLPETQRVGAFVQVMPRDKLQPPISWFYSFHIPVWYRWGVHEIQSVKQDPTLAQFAPLPEHLQSATTIIVRQPPGFCSIGDRNQEHSKKKSPSWHEFFAAHDSLNARNLASETVADAAKRLQREKNPPTTSAKVYEWLPSLEDPSTLTRDLVIKSRRWEVLSSYPSEQKRYDSWRNEWDCCEAFQPGVTVDDDLEDVVMYMGSGAESEIDPYNNNLSPPPVSFPFGPSSGSHSSMEIASPEMLPSTDIGGTLEADDFNLSLLQHAYEAVEILSHHYGFVPPLSFPSASSLKDVEVTEVQSKLLRLLGLTAINKGITSTSIGAIALAFLEDLAAGRRPEKGSWDLERNNRYSLVNARHLRYLHCIQPKLFLFDFGRLSTVRWKLAVMNAVDALYICRLDPNFDEYDIARCLVQQGIRFQTLLSLRDIPHSPKSSNRMLPIDMLPIRLSGYQFSLRDYEAYRRQCSAIFAHPRARAALLRGGIVWRLAIEFLSFDDALQGPSIATTVYRHGLSVECQKGNILGDDDLTEVELNLICGAYICYTGKFQPFQSCMLLMK